MIDYPSALLVAVTFVVVGLAVFARGLGTRPIGRHRGGDVVVPFAELMPDWPTPGVGVVRMGFGWCEPCADITAGVITRDGFRCDCGTPAGGAR